MNTIDKFIVEVVKLLKFMSYICDLEHLDDKNIKDSFIITKPLNLTPQILEIFKLYVEFMKSTWDTLDKHPILCGAIVATNILINAAGDKNKLVNLMEKIIKFKNNEETQIETKMLDKILDKVKHVIK